jgi:hypothetical protein
VAGAWVIVCTGNEVSHLYLPEAKQFSRQISRSIALDEIADADCSDGEAVFYMAQQFLMPPMDEAREIVSHGVV